MITRVDAGTTRDFTQMEIEAMRRDESTTVRSVTSPRS